MRPKDKLVASFKYQFGSQNIFMSPSVQFKTPNIKFKTPNYARIKSLKIILRSEMKMKYLC